MDGEAAATAESDPLAVSLGPWRRDPVAERLRGIRFRQQLFNFLALVLGASCAFAGFVIAEMLLDRRCEFSSPVRQALLAVSVWTLLGVVVTIAVRLLLKHSNPLFYARAAERALGVDDDLLLTYVGLRRARTLSPVEAQAAALLKDKAVQRLSVLDSDQVVDTRPVTCCLWALGGSLAIVLGLYVAWGPTFADSLYRCIFPARNIAPPRATAIVLVTPGDGLAVAGEPVRFAAEVRADRPSSEATLVYRVLSESSDVQETLPRITGDQTALSQLHGTANALYAKELPGFVRPVAYWIRCDGVTAGPFQLNVVERPLVSAVNVRVRPPSYASFAPVRDVAGGHVQAIAGSRLEISATVTQPPRKPRLLGDAESAWLQAGGTRLPMTPNDKTLTATVPVEGDFEYKIGYVDSNGLASRESILYRVKALRDQPPVAFLHREDGTDDTPAALDSTVSLRGAATDDLGVRKLSLRTRVLGMQDPGKQRVLDCSPSVPDASVVRPIQLDLRPLGLKAGDVLECVLVAEDVKRPVGQKVDSAPLRIPISSAAGEQLDIQIGRKPEPPEEPRNEPPSAETKRALLRPQNPAEEQEKLKEQANELLRALERLVEQGADDESKKQIAEVVEKEQQVADELVKSLDEEQKEAEKQGSTGKAGAGEQSGDRSNSDRSQDGAKKSEPKEGDQNKQGKQGQKNGGAGKAGNAESGSGGGQKGGQQPSGQNGGQQDQGQGQNGQQAGSRQSPGQNGKESGSGQGQGQGQSGSQGQGQGQGQGQQQNAAGSGAPGAGGSGQNNSSGTSNAGAKQQPDGGGTKTAHSELDEALSKMRDGEANDDVVRQARDAFDHLFRAGRAFRDKDREKLAALNKDAGATGGPAASAPSAQPAGPKGRARTELSDGKTTGVLRNTPGEMKEDDLGQGATKGQVKVAPEYRKALEDYYKAIAQ